jgi:hypothetical protein
VAIVAPQKAGTLCGLEDNLVAAARGFTGGRVGRL